MLPVMSLQFPEEHVGGPCCLHDGALLKKLGGVTTPLKTPEPNCLIPFIKIFDATIYEYMWLFKKPFTLKNKQYFL